jgi:hypothetical protein
MLRRVLIVTLASIAFACSSSGTPTDGGAEAAARPTCVEIIGQCHEADMGTGAPHDCHEGAHEAWTEKECQANKLMCLAACTLTDGGAPDAAEDAHDDAAHSHDH